MPSLSEYSGTPLRALHALVLDLFTAEEFRRWLRHGPDAELVPEIPGESAADAVVVDKALGVLMRHRRIDVAFFARMIEAREHQSDAIALVAALWDDDPTKSPRSKVLKGADAIAAQHAEAAARPAALPRWYPHPRGGSSRFVGRTQELADLHTMLQSARLVGIIAQIRGLGGIGKSLLAIEYASRHAESWPGGVFWVEADPSWATAPRTADERLVRRHAMLAGFASSLGVRTIPGDLVATAWAVECALADRCGARQLWIVDDLPPGVDQVFIASLMPACPGGALLVTTRWMALEALPHRLDLGVLGAADAYTLLTGRCPSADEAERAAAHALATDVGHHPLALDVLGALVRDELSPTPYAHWRARLAAPGDDFDREGEALYDQLPTGCERAITRVLATSLRNLRTDHALEVLRIAAGMGDAPIPGDLLHELLNAVGQATGDEFRHAVAELAAHALVVRTPGSKGIQVHAIVRWVARRWPVAGATNARIDVVCCEAIFQRFRVADDLPRHAELFALVPHAEHLSWGTTIEAVIVGASLGHYAEIRGDYHEAQRRAELALRRFAEELVSVNPFSVMAKLNLGVARMHLGDPSGAEQLFRAAFIDSEQLSGPTDRITLTALHGLGTTFEGRGNLQAARDVYERVYEAQRHALGPTHPDTLRTLAHLGGTLSDLGDLAASRALLEPATATCEAELGLEHLATLSLGAFLAVTLKRQGELEHARALEERLFDTRVRVLGAEHPVTLSCAQQLAATMRMQGEFADARRLGEQTWTAQVRVLGGEHPTTLQSQRELGVTRLLQKDLDGAQELIERTRNALSRILGAKHPNTLIVSEDLAEVAWERRDLYRARVLLEEVLAGRSAFLKPDSSDILQVRFKLAHVLLALGDQGAAQVHVVALEPLAERRETELSLSERNLRARLPALVRAVTSMQE